MKRISHPGRLACVLVTGIMFGQAHARDDGGQGAPTQLIGLAELNSRQTLSEGRQIFRFDTFGDEAYWGDTLKLHQAIEGESFGGVGPGVSPKIALAVGLKVDVDALPKSLIASLNAGQVNLDAPATTLTLLKLNAILGVTGHFDSNGALRSVGIQCSLCHSTVDNSLAPGIGRKRVINC